jgi:hypothetical protein
MKYIVVITALFSALFATSLFAGTEIVETTVQPSAPVPEVAPINSEIGHYRIITETKATPHQVFGDQPTGPSGDFFSVFASGKSNQYENALAFLEKDGKVYNIVLYRNAEVIMDANNNEWLATYDCKNKCYNRLKIYQLGPNVSRSEITVLPAIPVAEPVIEYDPLPVAEPVVQTKGPEIVLKDAECVEVLDHKCLNKATVEVFSSNRDVRYVQAESPYPVVVFIPGQTESDFPQHGVVSQGSIWPHQISTK